ncbi:MAG: tRNA threonylcarbamoyladenosine dehydratase [Planctomycetia bacterium]|nr:tRNA threonylcarbamoyladenosine dehydratase [Planctomycetia bacterium]
MTASSLNASCRNANTCRDESQFDRLQQMLGPHAVERLHGAKVAVAGLGAVGSYAVEALARSGVGRFSLVDFDVVKPSNINRQLFALWNTVGRSKTELARERILAIWPRAQVEIHNVLLNAESLPDVLDSWSDADYVIDAIDSLGPKTTLIHELVTRKIPFISCMGAALRTRPDLIRVGRLTEVEYCPLAAMLRKRLRRGGISTDDVRCVFSPEPIREKYRDRIGPMESPDPDREHGRYRNILGSLATITALFGLTAAHEVIMAIALEKK